MNELVFLILQLKFSNNLRLVCYQCKDDDEEAGRLVNDPWIRKAASLVYQYYKPLWAPPCEWGPYPRRECGFAVNGRPFILEDELSKELETMDPLDTWRTLVGANASDEEVQKTGAQVAWRNYRKGEYLQFNPSVKFERREDR